MSKYYLIKECNNIPFILGQFDSIEEAEVALPSTNKKGAKPYDNPNQRGRIDCPGKGTSLAPSDQPQAAGDPGTADHGIRQWLQHHGRPGQRIP